MLLYHHLYKYIEFLYIVFVFDFITLLIDFTGTFKNKNNQLINNKMKVNLFLKKKQEKIELEENPSNFEELKSSIRKVSEEIDDNLKVSFIDIENEEIEILDEHDFEYLV